MIEATCSACGTLNRIVEAELPASAKFVNCASCKSRVALPAAKVMPPLPRIGVPAIPRMPGAGQIPLGPAGGKPLPAPPPLGGSADDIIDLADLPAPRRASSLVGGDDLPAPKPRQELADLPAPRARGPRPSPPAHDVGGTDLPAPKVRGVAPAPRTGRAVTDFDLPVVEESDHSDVSDLPAPRGRAEIADLPAPKPRAEIADLPAPKPRAAIADLPAPKPRAAIADLPAPKAHSDVSDLPMPRRGQAQGAGLPAPKGFFDDLPQPARGGGAAQTDVAPKGFFDDLPQPSKGRGPDIAPKGFFDDLPQKSSGGRAEPPAPKGFFDDLPQPARGHGRGGVEPETGLEPLELADDAPIKPRTGAFDDLDLSAPSTGAAIAKTPAPPPDEDRAAIKISKPKSNAPKPPMAALAAKLSANQAAAGAALELEVSETDDARSASQRLGPKPERALPHEEALAAKKRKAKRNRLVAAVLGVALLGGGGFLLYTRHAAKQARTDAISEQLSIARKALTDTDDARFTRATTATAKLLQIDPKHGEALGIGAEATIAGAFADGRNVQARFGIGRKMISDALGTGSTGPAIDRAQVLSTLTTAPARAVPRLQALLVKHPKDAGLALYLGWAQAAAGDAPAAIKAFDQALTLAPDSKVLPLLGRARAKLALLDTDGAQADFAAVLAVQKDNIPAQVGLASTLPQSEARQQEADLLAVLARKDIGQADPRAVVQAWVIAGDVARNSGRLDAARERYRKAIALDARDVPASTGLAEVELLDGKLELAVDLITKALVISPDDANAQMVAASISIKQTKLDDAQARIDALAGRTPPLSTLDQARLQIVRGKLLEAEGKHEEAVEAYVAGAKLAGDTDLTPMMLAVAKLAKLADSAAADGKPVLELDLRERSERLLSQLETSAETDPQIALTLGTAYLQARSPAKAEPWLRKVLEARPDDVDAMYQLGKTLAKLDKGDEALALFKQAIAAAPTRAEIGLELARTYEGMARDDEAGAIYDKLVAADEVSLELRGHAGKYYARTGQLDKAGVQGNKIIALDPENPAGHYLKGEGLFAAGNYNEARQEFTQAVSLERDAQFLDGQGRAAEQLGIQRGEMIYGDEALRAYAAAAKLDKNMFNPLVGQGRLYVARRQSKDAVRPLLAANALKKDDAEVAYLLGAAYQELQQKKVAVQWLERANKLQPDAETSYRLGQLFADPAINQAGPAAAAFGQAADLASKEEKRTGKIIPWLTDALYFYGRLSYDTGNEPAARNAWEKYIGRRPTPGARVDEVKRMLATSLKN